MYAWGLGERIFIEELGASPVELAQPDYTREGLEGVEVAVLSRRSARPVSSSVLFAPALCGRFLFVPFLIMCFGLRHDSALGDMEIGARRGSARDRFYKPHSWTVASST